MEILLYMGNNLLNGLVVDKQIIGNLYPFLNALLLLCKLCAWLNIAQPNAVGYIALFHHIILYGTL